VPIKYEALNDLRRVYDVEHDRFQMRERGYMLFPFLAANSYNYILVDRRLDGDIPYDTTTGGMFGNGQGPMTPHRVANLTNDFQGGDGVHARRMWMMNNPAVLVRTLMDPATQVSLPRIDGKYVDVDVTLKQGDHLTVGFFTANRFCQAFCKDLPAFVRWGAPHPDLGQADYTTWFTGYEDINGLMLPFGYDTRLDWRNTDWQRLYVDHYEIDSQIPDLAAPPEVRNAPAPPSVRVAPVVPQKVADHIWRLAPTGTTAIEFADHITLFELDASPEQAKATIAFARTLVPGKPVTQLIVSHEHFDHVSGLRQAVAEGLTVIGRRASGEYFEEMVEHPAPEFPDDLARNPKPLHFIPMDDKLVLKDSLMELQILWARNNTHMADAIVAYAPAQKVIMEGDVATASLVWQLWADNLRDIIDYYHLDVKIDSPGHDIDPMHRGALTMEQLDELVKGGVDRARQLCTDQLAKGVYLVGCPVWSKRY
jgi:glyoxylase-like metal-dependent hydrolase (beta-lactamase superfamily II)